MAELSDDLVSAARCGDPDAVGTVYTVLSPKVHGYLRARGCEDNGTFLAKPHRDRAADAAAGARDERPLAFEVAGHQWISSAWIAPSARRKLCTSVTGEVGNWPLTRTETT